MSILSANNDKLPNNSVMHNKLHGVLLLDKPAGITSNKALQLVKHCVWQIDKVKAGHTGSLDPLATGMLPICLGEATKFASFLLNADKEYLVTMQLGIQTDTGDLDGAIIADCPIADVNFTDDQVKDAIATFMGEIDQIPPIYSAIKYHGQRCYKLARANLINNVTLAPRKVKIYNIQLLSICNYKKQITLKVNCSKGTYIRSLIIDLAAALDSMATVAALRRTKLGNFTSANLISISQLQELVTHHQLLSKLLPIEACLVGLPKLKITSASALALSQGKKICVDELDSLVREDLISKCKNHNIFCLINNDNNQLCGIGQYFVDSNVLAAKRLVQNKYQLYYQSAY